MIQLQKKLKYLVCGGVTLVALASATPAGAVSFVSTYRPAGNTTEVGIVDPATGIYSPKGTFELQLTDIAVNQSGRLFGVTNSQLYALPTGLASNVSLTSYIPLSGGLELGITGMNGLAFDNNNNLFGLAGRSASSGVGSPGFYSINTSTGIASLISSLPTLAPSAFGNGTATLGDTSDLVYNPATGKFLAVSGNSNAQLFSIDPTTGATTTIGSTGFGFVSGLTLEGGVLRGYTTNKNQIAINIATGVGTFDKSVTGIIPQLDGSNSTIGGAASTITATAVPEPSFLPGFVFLGTCLGARFAMKRKQQPIDE